MQSNLYAVQEDPSKPLGLTKSELECFLGTLFAMSLVKRPIHVCIGIVSCNALLFVKP